jgi:enterochelin esterase-like enzyme
VTAPSRFPWRLAATLLAAAVLLVGAYGTYTYVSAYQTYRGFAPPSDPHGVSAGRTLNVTFYSRALHSMRHYLVYEPPGYDALVRAGKRLPVFYMLHGSPGIPDLYLKVGDVGVALDVLLHEHRVRPMLIVIPDGSNGSIWTDTEWADTPSGNYESFITDVIDDVDHRFATIPSRLDRALAGYSEGAYASINYTFHHLDTVSIAESWSGYFSQTATGVFRHADPTALTYNSPARDLLRIAPRLRRVPLSVFIYSGEADPTTLVGESFAASLAAAGAHVFATAYPGAHDWALWRARMYQSLRFASRFFGHRRRGRSSLNLVSARQLATQHELYDIHHRRTEIAFCNRFGPTWRPYCPQLLAEVAPPVQLAVTLTRPGRAVLAPGAALHGFLSSSRAARVTLTVTLRRARRHLRRGRRRTIRIASASAVFAAAGVVPISVPLTPAGRRALGAGGAVKLTIAATARSAAGGVYNAVLTVRVAP